MSEPAATTRPSGCQAVVDALDAEQLAARMEQGTVAEVPFYATVRDPVRAAQMREHCLAHARAVIDVLARGRPPSHDELGFVRELATLRARQLVPLSALLHAYRIGYRVTWESVARASDALGTARDVLADLGEHAMGYFDAISSAAAAAYASQRERAATDGIAAQAELLEHLLLGAPTTDADATLQLAAFGLTSHRGAQVFVVDPGGEPTAAELAELATMIARGLSLPHGGALVVPRHRQILGVVATEGDATEAIASSLRVAMRALARPLHAGIGQPVRELAGVPRSHEEAQRARSHADDTRPIRTFAEIPLFDDLLAQADPMLRGRVPAWVDVLATEDASGELLATLRALLHHGQSTARAAEVLGVHVNTVRYRLARLAAITGRDLGDFRELVEVVVALRLRDPRCL